ncbi:ribosome assembly RNA-binding protein YhbY [Rudaea cellulosilytica]|uniref:ribosome assembly RNA-binding protein YhbY n=1 Tax=Rudaea cellulosilytica TaxID=540746 RepID=UPI0003618C75|nr:ribosome assembly RNA-binding protein YhbY [Rudaea cellulosilytica]
MALTNTQIRYLRGLAHDLNPVILVGNKGITPALIKEFDAALDQHELVKVKIAGDDRQARKQQIDELAGQGGAEVVQRIGHVASYFRRNEDAPKIALPR